MEIFEKTFKIINKSDCILLRPLYDLHIGSDACDLEQLKRDIDWIKRRPNAYTFLGGDIIEAINPSDKRFELAGVVEKMRGKLNDLAQEQVKEAVAILKPIKGKILYSLEGNHEAKVKKNYYYDCSNSIAEQLGVPFKSYSCLSKLIFEYKKCKSRVDIYSHHGYGGGRKAPSKITALMEFAMSFDASIYIMGHNHGIGVHSQPRLGLGDKGRNKLVARNMLFVLGGCYTKTYKTGNSNYAEKTAYPVSHIGSNIIKIIPFPVESKTLSLNGESNSLPAQFFVEGLGR